MLRSDAIDTGIIDMLYVPDCGTPVDTTVNRISKSRLYVRVMDIFTARETGYKYIRGSRRALYGYAALEYILLPYNTIDVYSGSTRFTTDV